MKEDLKTILYMGLGAVSETSDMMKEVTDSLYVKGKELYEKGVIKNEELKHNLNEIMGKKEECGCKCHGEDRVNHIVNRLNSLSDEERIEIMNKMGWTDCIDEEGADE